MSIKLNSSHTSSGERRLVPAGGPTAGRPQNFSANIDHSDICPDWAILNWETRYDMGPLYRVKLADSMLASLTLLYREKYEEIRYLVHTLCAKGYDHSHVERILRNKYEELKDQILAERDDRQQRILNGDVTVIPQTGFEIQLMQEVRKTKLQREQEEEVLAAASSKNAEMRQQQQRTLEDSVAVDSQKDFEAQLAQKLRETELQREQEEEVLAAAFAKNAEVRQQQQRILQGSAAVDSQMDFEVQPMRRIQKTKHHSKREGADVEQAQKELAAAIAETAKKQRQLYALEQNSTDQLRQRLAALEKEKDIKNENDELERIDHEFSEKSTEWSELLSEMRSFGTTEGPADYFESAISKRWKCTVKSTLQNWLSDYPPPSEKFLREEEARKQRMEDTGVFYQKTHENELEKQKDIQKQWTKELEGIDFKLETNLEQIKDDRQADSVQIQEELDTKNAETDAWFQKELAEIEASKNAARARLQNEAAERQLRKAQEAQKENMEITATQQPSEQPHSKEAKGGFFGRFFK
ncbi:MAG: hypothetical protein LBI69_01550 [Puniceicoccales bacterium]|jgi:hypothetical protein|nr:hypothetical protein [Puniceicoccales bacterium]